MNLKNNDEPLIEDEEFKSQLKTIEAEIDRENKDKERIKYSILILNLGEKLEEWFKDDPRAFDAEFLRGVRALLSNLRISLVACEAYHRGDLTPFKYAQIIVGHNEQVQAAAKHLVG